MEPLKQRSDNQSGDLFPLAPRFRIVELGTDQAKAGTDDLNVLKELIVSSEEMYPNIGRWFSGKVVPGLEAKQRLAWVAYEGEKAVAAAVLKRGKHAKFCHLRIDPGFQDMDLGQLFFLQ